MQRMGGMVRSQAAWVDVVAVGPVYGVGDGTTLRERNRRLSQWWDCGSQAPGVLGSEVSARSQAAGPGARSSSISLVQLSLLAL